MEIQKHLKEIQRTWSALEPTGRIAFLSRLSWVLAAPNSSLLRAQLSNGAVVWGPNKSHHGGRAIFLFRDLYEQELKSLGMFLHPGDVFVDVGANVGCYAVKAAKEVGQNGIVVAVEPSAATSAYLVESARRGRLENLRVRTYCLGGNTANSTFYLSSDGPTSYSLVRPDVPTECISVFTVSLDDLCSWEGLQRLDYLKIDAEGAEEAILCAGQASISRFRPIIQAEAWICKPNLPINDYLTFRAKGSSNVVFVPRENSEASQVARNLGWIEEQETAAQRSA
jgi:FkbM family methyltransferase